MENPDVPPQGHPAIIEAPALRSPLISATVLADSISPEGVRITTLELVYPRFIHAEVMTHRVFSRNASSSRAIPWKRMRQMLLDHPAVPASWRLNQPGMQGYEVAPIATALEAEGLVIGLMMQAIDVCDKLETLNIHKQSINRYIEPWQHIKTVMTGVWWDNWTGLRNHHAADPTIEPLAKAIDAARAASTPRELAVGEWHLPYISDEERGTHDVDTLQKVSVARCARTSYNSNVDGKRSTVEKDIELHDMLLVAQPIHASPAEHQATPDFLNVRGKYTNPHRHGNLYGWQQYRKFLANETMDKVPA